MTKVVFIFVLVAISTISSVFGKSVTYPGYGTWSTEDFSEIKNTLVACPLKDDALPQSPEHIDPEFLLYTRENPDEPQKLHYNNSEEIQSSRFDGKKMTRVLVHGFMDNQDFGKIWMEKFRHTILENEDSNVISVDWHKGNFFPYFQSVVNTHMIGIMLGIQIDLIIKTKNGSLDNVHLMGHSLGAHVVGFAGRKLNGQLGRVTGLDPAGPCYEGVSPKNRLWYTDAKFVDSIHSDARPLLPYVGFGMYETNSHIDFFPNGGRHQPGCNDERIELNVFAAGLYKG